MEGEVLNPEQFGFIAQDVVELYPEMIFEDENGYLAINYTQFIPLMVEALKEQNTKIESLETELTSLNALELQSKTINKNETTDLNLGS